ncbi:MAG: sigma-70 family RNA polymerase sigma factor [Rikenellaceae bacterium]|nr:sigma-70 family RNA polymerase sigma factor [Rikenellaceae bacterium]
MRSRFQEETLQTGEPQGALAPELYVGEELRSLILDAVDKLPARQKESFLLSKFQNMSYAEIGQKLEISPRTVEKHVEVASKALRQELFRHLYSVLMAWVLMGR